MSTKAKNYPRLHKLDWTPNWVYRQYSKEKRKEFVWSTGLEATEKNAPRAYKLGVEAFDLWLGQFLPSGRQLQIKDLARANLASKESSKGGKRGSNYRSVRNQTDNHIIPAFGHLRPDQMTSRRWEQYDCEERKRVRFDAKGKALPPRTALFNTRKVLSEILARAEEEGLIKRVPDLKNNDPKAAPPKYLTRKEILSIRHQGSPSIRLLMFFMEHQGARPGEVLQYRWDMINLADGPTGMLNIPGAITKTGRARSIPLNTRVHRYLKWARRRSASPFLFPSPKYSNRPVTTYNKAWERACTLAGVEFDIYNLRDTWITNALKRGLSSTFIGRYCDNSPAMIEARYAVAEREAMKGVAG
jgi:integrase